MEHTNNNLLLSRVKCFECKCILQSPIVLPCFKSVCNKHVPKQGTYSCASCQKDHYVPKNGYAPNMALINLIDLHFPDYKRALDSCHLYMSSIDRLKRLKTQPPKHLIGETLGELKTQIKLTRNKLIRDIEQRFDRVLDEVVMYEQECFVASSVLNELGHQSFGNEVEKKKSELENMRCELSDFGTANQAKWKKIAEKNELELARIVKIEENVKAKLFLNKLDMYEKKKEKICNLKILDFDEYKKFELKFTHKIKAENMDLKVDLPLLNEYDTSNDYEEDYIDFAADVASNNQNNMSNDYEDIEDQKDETGNMENDENIRSLSDKEVAEIMNKIPGIKSVSRLAYKLIPKYFSKKELRAGNVTLLGGSKGLNPKLDPARIELIKSHLVMINGGPLSSKQWTECKKFMSSSLCDSKREYRNRKR